MTAPAPGRWQRRCRKCVRAGAVALVLVILLLFAAAAYVNEVGLPDFVKRPLLEKLRTQGIALSFTRIRWRLHRGIVAENVRFGRADAPPDSPHFSAREVEVQLNQAALRHGVINVDALLLRGGEAVWPVTETNGPPRRLAITEIQTQLRFPAVDQWELDHFSAAFAGTLLKVSGAVTNASAIRDWPVFQAPPGQRPGRLEPSVHDFAATLARIKFGSPPEIDLTIHGDGLDLQSFRILLLVRARDAETPWGKLTNGFLTARIIPPGATNEERRGEFTLQAGSAQTPWGTTRNLHVEMRATNDPLQTNLVHCQLDTRADEFNTPWLGATNARAAAHWTHSFTNAIPLNGVGEVRLSRAASRWGTSGEIWLTSRLATPPTAIAQGRNPDWGWWAGLEPYQLEWAGGLTDYRREDLLVHELTLGGSWRAPRLTITNLSSHVFNGDLKVSASLDVATRGLNFDLSTDVDAHQMAPLLPATAREPLMRVHWDKPPLLVASGTAVLPAWTNREPDRFAASLADLRFSAELGVGSAAYEGVSLLSAHSHINLSNLVWQLPDLIINRPEGSLRAAGSYNQNSQDYAFHVHSEIDHQAARPLVDPGARVVFDQIVLGKPPVIDADITGRGTAAATIFVTGSISATNLSVRRELPVNLHADLSYHDKILEVRNPLVEREGKKMTATFILVDFPSQRMFLTNAVSNMDPRPLLHIIGPVVTATMAPYEFLAPPLIYCSGIIPLGEHVPADLSFHIIGGPFHWTRFNLAEIDTRAHWIGDHLYLSDVRSEFYGGRLAGGAVLDFSPRIGTLFSFTGTLTNVDLHPLVADAFLYPSNHLEGRLAGEVAITEANSDDWKSWFGHGQLELRDGLIWEVPIFGIFSKVLDTFSPSLKLGESRATAATAAFTITNSVIRSENLEITTRGVRMKYRGTVDFDGQTEAVMEAAILKGTPVIGPLVSLVLTPVTKVFEYKVRGTLSDPQVTPLYVPKILMDILHPIGTFKRLFPLDSGGTTNNPAPAKQP